MEVEVEVVEVEVEVVEVVGGGEREIRPRWKLERRGMRESVLCV